MEKAGNDALKQADSLITDPLEKDSEEDDSLTGEQIIIQSASDII